MSSDRAGDESQLPEIDDGLVEPETRYEMLDGELVYVSPARRRHATRHAQLCALIEAHSGPEFEVACDLLTRTSQVDDFAPDVSVSPSALDPTTGRRQLAQLVFEIVSTQTLRNAGRKAAKLAARGVRRVFAIDLERSRALEWSAELGAWSVLDSSGQIDDPALDVPLPIEMLIHEAKMQDAMARALRARRNPVIEEGLAESRARGWAEAVLGVLVGRGVAVDREARERILAERDPARLDRWLARAVVCGSAAELFVEP
jgi:Uma2 family endonuclease